MKANDKTIVTNLGKVIVERGEVHYLVCFPDGAILTARTKIVAERLARKWFTNHTGPYQVTVGQVEYRG
jgi:hypothetical protein